MSEKDIAMRQDQSPELPAQYSLPELEKMAHTIVKSGLFGMKDQSQAMALMLLCQASGMHPMKAVQRYDIIQGRPALKSQTMLADFKKAGNQVRWIRRDDRVCEAEFADRQGNVITIKWTMEMAQKAGLTDKQNWKMYPRQMLSARVISEGVKALAPEVAEGLYVPEEVMDFGEGFGSGRTEKTINEAPEAPQSEPSETSIRANNGIEEAMGELDLERLQRIRSYIEQKLEGIVTENEKESLLNAADSAIQQVTQALENVQRPGDSEEQEEQPGAVEPSEEPGLGLFAPAGGAK
ncbi:MAG: hypothetical protein RH862_20275 [Leptospiraceae bacterium]